MIQPGFGVEHYQPSLDYWRDLSEAHRTLVANTSSRTYLGMVATAEDTWPDIYQGSVVGLIHWSGRVVKPLGYIRGTLQVPGAFDRVEQYAYVHSPHMAAMTRYGESKKYGNHQPPEPGKREDFEHLLYELERGASGTYRSAQG